MKMYKLSEDQTSKAILILSGVVGHVLFNRLEPRSPRAIFSLLFGPPTILALWLRASYNGVLAAATLPYLIYLCSLLFSVVIYRLSPFHPLARFPGPTICKVTRIWSWYIVWTGKQHIYFQSVHARYGTHVRMGPNHLSVCDAEAIPTVLGPNGFMRGERYDVTKPHGNISHLQGLRDKQEHAVRRRVWDRSLNTSAVQGYYDMLFRRIHQFVGALEKKNGPVDLALWFSYFSFDFLGDLAYGGAFDLMQQGVDTSGYMRMVGVGSRHQELAGTIPWIKPWHILLPSASGLGRLRKFAMESVLARRAQGSMTKDIFYYLLDEEGVGAGSPSIPQLTMESSLAISAGSDTTSTSLSNLFYYLLLNPKSLHRLQVEVDNAFPPGSELFDPTVTANMSFLNAVINETLRLQPVTPSGVQRAVPSRGTVVAGRFVPGATTVQIPTYPLQRDPRYFSPDPDSFRPERWLEKLKGNYRLQQSAFIPFSYGPMNCVGKNLALQEQRSVICALLQRFEFEFAPGWDTNEWERNLTDVFMLAKGDLPVIIRLRQ